MVSYFPGMTIHKFTLLSSTNVSTHQIDLRSDGVSKIESEYDLKHTNQYPSNEQQHLHNIL